VRNDDFPHPVPPQAFMTWKENWVFPAIDAERRVASLFHFSLRPRDGEGIFTAKFAVDGWEHRYVGRSPIPAQVADFHPIANEQLRFEIVEPEQRFRVVYASDEIDADMSYTARFPRYEFDGPKAPGESLLGEIGRSVFPFNHHEQSLRHEGTLTLRAGPRAGETLRVAGYACRDHSWGWRDDLSFRHHHWLCASFDDRFVQGSAMEEVYYPHGPKSGGWISTAAGNDPVVAVDLSDVYWLEPNEPLPPLDRDVRYRVTTVGGVSATVVAHLSRAYGRLYLSARSPDRTQVYQDVQMFCDVTLEETGQRGAGVLEVGKHVEGPDVVERTRAPARP
jgi:hypothetical protein